MAAGAWESMGKGTGKGGAANEVASGDLIPVAACCCAIYSCYTKYPECCGGYSNATCLCIQQELTICKCHKEMLDKDEFCLCYQGKCACLLEPAFCKVVSQLFCIDGRAAIPCDEDVPCMLNLCYVSCYPKCGVCKKVSEIVEPGAATETPAAVPPNPMIEAQTMDHRA